MANNPQVLMAVSLGLILTCVVVIILFIIFVHTMPGKIARKRGSAQTEAIEILSLLGLLIFPLWMAALVWAYMKPFTLSVALADTGGGDAVDPQSAPDPEPMRELAQEPKEDSVAVSDSAPQSDAGPATAQAKRPANLETQA
ncbi:DUF3302 domain-containing protein [Lamprobacter modestohalophilus]|uniref:DUF3302 domain-containing protein n=1 Tax=Lamprobacter modestohalophilus TaxID=1064514 RepID=UPI002ADEDBE9|nr:DUF3302 domain-containing protein [Lamprobacter modestohalophilus]MEA1048426.1 DUF3302 domain-containing protein [Lamprobacter modestohalophilus]